MLLTNTNWNCAKKGIFGLNDNQVKKQSLNVLVSPLDWGLGHAARLVVIILACRERGWKVVIAGNGKSLDFLRSRFPDLPWVSLHFKRIRYSKKDKFFRNLIPQLPGFIRAVRENRRQVKGLIKEYSIDAIICDHRYGLGSQFIPAVFVSNQVWLLTPGRWSFAEKWIYKIHMKVLSKYRYLWLADFPGEKNFTGKQTHIPEQPSSSRFIGPVSRFIGIKDFPEPENEGPDILVILSGPEPQRSILETKIAGLLLRKAEKVIVIRGIPPPAGNPIPDLKQEENIAWLDHADDITLAGLIKSAGKIICRPGLSMLSDLAALGRTALLVPTPGQTEQNYMASRLKRKSYFAVIEQIDLKKESIDAFEPDKYRLFPETNLDALNKALDELFS